MNSDLSSVRLRLLVVCYKFCEVYKTWHLMRGDRNFQMYATPGGQGRGTGSRDVEFREKVPEQHTAAPLSVESNFQNLSDQAVHF